MKKTIINNEISCAYPDCCLPMTGDDLKRYFSCTDNRVGFRSEERHFAISAAWSKPGIINFLTDSASVIRGAERNMKKNLPDYKNTETYRFKVGSQNAFGIRFEYTATDKPIIQSGELAVFRYKKKFYSFYYISWKELNVENHAEFQQMLDSILLV